MKDCENIKFCGTHGIELDDDRCCNKCKELWAEKYLGTNREDLLKGQHGTYLQERIAEGPIKDKDFYIKKNNSDVITQGYFCDNCELIMWHHLNYCPKCVNKFIQRKLTYQELNSKYGNYRTGY